MMTTPTGDISVVICAYTEERWDDIAAAVDSMQHQTLLPREIILVIDHNSRMLERVRAELPGVIAVENSEPKGLSGARNSGIAVAQGSLIAFLDDDATAEPDWLLWLSRACEDPRVLGASGRVEPNWVGQPVGWFPREFFWALGCTYTGLPEEQAEVRNLYGGCSCIKRELFQAVGGFRSGIGRVGNRPLGGEETELCIRARQHWPQRTFLFEPRAIIHHKVPTGRATLKYFRARCYFEGQSKAHIARIVGTKDGLASERQYTFHTLPAGVRGGLADALLRHDFSGLQRAAAIVAGLSFTTVGYFVGKLSGPGIADISAAHESAGLQGELTS